MFDINYLLAMPFIYADLERILDRNFNIQYIARIFSTGEATFSNPE